MRLSTKGRYGLKAMFDLALHFGSGPISLSSISERQDISLNYLEQLILMLKKAGLVTSIRGAYGGYTLSRPPNKITVGDVLNVLEGTLSPVSCSKDDDEHCKKSGECITKKIWDKLYNSINDVVDSITLGDMVNDHLGLTTVKLKGEIK
jgi:Rrf2 family protein